MRLYHTCGTVLTLLHSVSINLQSNFDVEGERVTLTKHRILDSKSLTPFLSLEKCHTFFCNRCKENVSYEQGRVSCDDCGGLFLFDDLKNIGGLFFCKRCLNKNKNFDDFSIFGERSKTKKQRDKAIEEERINLSRNIRQQSENIVPPPNLEISDPTLVLNSLWAYDIPTVQQTNSGQTTTYNFQTVGGNTAEIRFTAPVIQTVPRIERR